DPPRWIGPADMRHRQIPHHEPTPAGLDIGAVIDRDGADGDERLTGRGPWGFNLRVLEYVTLAVLIENDGLQLSSSDSASLEGPDSVAELYRVMVAFPYKRAQ